MSNVHRLHRIVVAGRDTCDGSCETRAGCNCDGRFVDAVPVQPSGLDQQGRWPTSQPMAAEACNATDDDDRPHSAAAARFWTRYLLVLLVACAGGIAAWMG